MPYGYYSVLDKSSLQPKIAKNDYAKKHIGSDEATKAMADERKWIEDQFQKQKEEKKEPTIFNGEKAIFYTKDDGILKIVRSDYANVRAAGKSKAKDADSLPDLRQHFCAGVIIACITKDNKVVVGSRDVNRKKDNPNDFPAQFPCGFIDVDNKTGFFEDIKKDGNGALIRHFKSNALRELKEEVLNFEDSKITNVEYIGGIFDEKTWPSKKEGSKKIKNFKSFVVKVDVDMTFAELMAERSENPPQDLNEIKTLNAIELADIAKDGGPMKVELEGKTREFVAEHPVTFKILQRHLELNKKPAVEIKATDHVGVNKEKPATCNIL